MCLPSHFELDAVASSELFLLLYMTANEQTLDMQQLDQMKEMVMEVSRVQAKDPQSRLRRSLREGGVSIATLLCFLSLFTVVFGSLVTLLHSAKSLLFITPSPGKAISTVQEFSDSLWHSMRDEELIRRALEVPSALEDHHSRGGRGINNSKMAFMFLTRGRIPLRPIWERFFRGHSGLFSIYIHTSPGFKEEPPEDSVFYRRRIPSKQVQWGRWSMIDAERRLLANALLDPCNARFVLLSESCIPLFNFPTVYSYLVGSTLSFVSSFDDPRKPGRGRYSRRMHPAVTLAEWRKGSQWFELHRGLAAPVVADRRYYRLFREHCRQPCYMDEHYLPTLVTKLFPGLNSNRSVTWVDWSRGGSHPAAYRARDVSVGLMERMRNGGSQCLYKGNATASICFLFARKFEAGALAPLLRIADAAKHLNWP